MSFLQSIRRQKERELATLNDVAATPSKTSGRFIQSVRSRSPALIAEVKPKSPSGGKLIERSAVPAIIEQYNQVAQAISVLCDEPNFGGGYDLLAEVRARTALPILAKEFIIDQRQIVAARVSGADAVLLIAALLTDQEIEQLAHSVLDLGMDVLFEVHTADEIERVPDLSSKRLAIGINNRDLDSLKIDLGTTEKLAPMVRTRFPQHLMLTESGIRTAQDCTRLRPLVDGFLIGTGLLHSDDSTSLLKYFQHPART